MENNEHIKTVTCNRCLLDSITYPAIKLDKKGVCDICHTYDNLVGRIVKKGDDGIAAIDRILQEIKTDGKGKEYDCIIGLSGGVDSAYLCYLSSVWKIRPLAVHIDNGWNSELAVGNIENIVRKLGIDLYTYVIDWKDMRDMHLSFLRSSVVDIELPFDNMYMATLFKVARRFGVKNILVGFNFLSEGYLPPNFNHYKFDIVNIKNIYKKFSGGELRDFPIISRQKMNYLTKVKGYRMIAPLNYLDYNKNTAKEKLINEHGWRDYGDKHFENIFTRFYQGYILPVKFRIDKRKAHLSTLICSGQITREDALNLYNSDTYFGTELCNLDLEFVLKKLEITKEEFDRIMNSPPVEHDFYGSSLKIKKSIKRLLKSFGIIKSR